MRSVRLAAALASAGVVVALSLGARVALLSGCGSNDPPVLGSFTPNDAGAHPLDAGVPSDAHAGKDAPVEDAAPEQTLRVLFIGNSYTYTNDLPGMLATLAKSSGVAPAIVTTSITVGGASLQDLWDAGAATGAIDTQTFTHVVLQEQSETPPCSPSGFYAAVTLFAGAARARGDLTALYETWARADSSTDYGMYPCLGGSPGAMQDELLAAYTNAANDAGATLVPVGEAWRAALAAYPSIVLFQSDGSHPTVAGTYLGACTFYDKLTGHQLPDAAAVPSGLAPADATNLRAAAWQAAQ